MNIFEILLYLFACLSAIYVTHLGFYLIGANLYDIKRLRRPDPNTTNGPDPGQDINLGLVTIGISARNEAKVIRRCLDSIRQSTYRPIQILVADDGSTDGTRQLVRDYQARHLEIDLQVFRQPVSIGKGKELNRLYRRYAKGKFCMTLDADSILHPDAITNAVRYFADPTVVAVAANVRIIEEPTILGVLQKLEHLIGYRSKKLYSVLNCECIVGGVASTYRASLLREVDYYDIDTVTEDIGLSMKAMRLGNRTHRLVYAADVIAQTEGVTTFKALVRQRFRWKYGVLQSLVRHWDLMLSHDKNYTASMTMYRLPMAVVSELLLLLSPIAWGYVLYMTFVTYNPQVVIGTYVMICVYVLITVWFDESFSAGSKLKLSAYAPVAYFLFYIMDLVQLIAVFRCCTRLPTLILQRDTRSTWTSPARTGRRVVGLDET